MSEFFNMSVDSKTKGLSTEKSAFAILTKLTTVIGKGRTDRPFVVNTINQGCDACGKPLRVYALPLRKSKLVEWSTLFSPHSLGKLIEWKPKWRRCNAVMNRIVPTRWGN